MSDQKSGDYALRQAERAAKRGDLAAAERWTKVAAQNQKQWEAEHARPTPPTTFEEDLAIREELQRRLERFAAFDADVVRWEVERDLYFEAVKWAVETGAAPPPPLRPHPAGAPENEEAHYIHLLQGPEPR